MARLACRALDPIGMKVTNFKATISALSLAALLSACAAPPMGPTVLVMPAPGKSQDQFAREQAECKNFASSETAGMAKQANNQAVGAAVLTTALGAAAGAAVGGGNGAAVGAASGATVGAGIGADASANAQLTIQQQYDNAYSQCMYTKGNQVPGYAPVPPPPPAGVYVVPTVHYDRLLVSQIQGELARLGYLHSTPDGAYGPHTKTAIQQFQAQRGLPQDGVPTASLLQNLQQN
jgi:uncharacterized protein YcfJ